MSNDGGFVFAVPTEQREAFRAFADPPTFDGRCLTRGAFEPIVHLRSEKES